MPYPYPFAVVMRCVLWSSKMWNTGAIDPRARRSAYELWPDRRQSGSPIGSAPVRDRSSLGAQAGRPIRFAPIFQSTMTYPGSNEGHFRPREF
jgi:hypothetical protein